MTKKEYKPNIISFLANTDYLNEMKESERKQFLSHASKIYRDPVFTKVIDELCSRAVCAGIMGGIENTKVASAINIFQEVKNRFAQLNVAFEELGGKEEFDAHESI